MLRISTISTLLFYVVISIGIHVDFDTCCNSIADISLTSWPDEKPVNLDDCCSKKVVSCCEEDEETCPVVSMHVQVLAEEQIASASPEFRISEIELYLLDTRSSGKINCPDSKDARLSRSDTDPPPLIYEEDLFIQYLSILTYG